MKPLTAVHIKIISQNEQYLPDYMGDYWEEDDGATLQVRATDLGDWRKSMAVAEHELFEYLLCRARGIAEPDILAFDRRFYRGQRNGFNLDVDEPGDDPLAPYHLEHEASNIVENICLHEMGVTQKEYHDAIGKVWSEK